MADGSNRDRLPPLLDPIDKDVVPEDEAPQIRFHVVIKWASESRKLGKSLDAVKEIVDGATSSGCVREKIEDFLNPLESGFGPDNPIGQLLVSFQKADSCLFMRHHSTGVDIRESSADISEKFHLVDEGPIAFNIHQNRGAPSLLRDDDGTAGATHPIYEAFSSGAEI